MFIHLHPSISIMIIGRHLHSRDHIPMHHIGSQEKVSVVVPKEQARADPQEI
jgi:hypothetical protein